MTQAVRSMRWWLVGGLVVCSGYGLGGLWPAAARDLGVTAFLVSAGVGLAIVASGAGAPGRPRRAWLVGVMLVLAGRGLFVAADQRSGPWLGPRGPASGLTTLAVEGASHPGPRCRVRVRGAGEVLWLDAPPQACPLAQGQRVRVAAARLHRHFTPELPGDPSAAAVARSRGAGALATVAALWPAGGEPSSYWSWVARQRQQAWSRTRGKPAAGFVVAAGLGVRSALAPADRDALRRAGLGHLVAVSGLHVGLAAWALLVLAMRVGARLRGSYGVGIVLGWAPLLAYVLLTGASPPAVRAGLMAVGVGLGGVLGRPHHGPLLLVATCVGMLVVRPAWIADPGFQLSAVAMATLVRAPAGQSIVRQTWRVSWAILPLSLWHFGQASAWGVLANLVAVPVFTLWILPLGLLGWLLVPWLGSWSLVPAQWGAQIVLDVAAVVASWPSPPGWSLAVVAAAALMAAVVWGRRGIDGRLRAGWGWVPPTPVAFAVLVVLAWPRVHSGPPASWWAAGSPGAPAVVTVARPPAGPVGCIHQASLAPSRWRTLLDAMGVPRVGFAPGSRVASPAPHEVALRRFLISQRRWLERPVGCPPPPAALVVRAAMDRCQRLAGTRQTIVARGPEGLRCFVHGRWSEPWLLDSMLTEVS